MTSLTGVFIFFFLKAEPEVDLSFQGVSGCRREEQGQWGRVGGRAHGAAATGLLAVMEGPLTGLTQRSQWPWLSGCSL